MREAFNCKLVFYPSSNSECVRYSLACSRGRWLKSAAGLLGSSGRGHFGQETGGRGGAAGPSPPALPAARRHGHPLAASADLQYTHTLLSHTTVVLYFVIVALTC